MRIVTPFLWDIINNIKKYFNILINSLVNIFIKIINFDY